MPGSSRPVGRMGRIITTRGICSKTRLLLRNISFRPYSQVHLPSPNNYLWLPLLTLRQDPIATQVTSAVLGPLPRWTFCSANAAMPPLPGSSPQRQPVHSDADFAHPTHPFALVVNVPLVTMTPSNGSTEVWLGTHTEGSSVQEGVHGERASGRIQSQLLKQRAATAPPVQPTVRKGSIVIRDLRLWHAGMPNQSDEVRIMLAIIHFAPWYRNPMRLQLGRDIQPVFDDLAQSNKLQLQTPTDWINREEALATYLGRGFGNSYNFDQEP